MENNQQSVWQFSDQLRIHTSNLANLSLNDSIWSTSFGAKVTDERRNFDIRVGGQTQINNSFSPSNDLINYNQHKMSGSDFNNNNNGFSKDGWKIGSQQKNNAGVNGGFNKGVYNSKPSNYNNSNSMNFKSGGKNKGVEDNLIYGGKTGRKNNNNIYFKSGGKNKGVEDDLTYRGKTGRKNNNNNSYNKNKNKNTNNNGGDNNSNKNSVDKRFKTLPPSESLPRNETIGGCGYIIVCNNDTMQENLKRELFGLPPRYRDSVRAITPGLPLFLYNYSTHQKIEQASGFEKLIIVLHTIFAFLISLLVALLQLMFQSKNVSPFETHRKLIVASIVAIVIHVAMILASVIKRLNNDKDYLSLFQHAILVSGMIASGLLLLLLVPFLGWSFLILCAFGEALLVMNNLLDSFGESFTLLETISNAFGKFRTNSNSSGESFTLLETISNAFGKFRSSFNSSGQEINLPV